jgi:hypothetical protein
MSIFSENKTEKWKQNNCPTTGDICHKPVQYNPPFVGNCFCFPLQNLSKVVTQQEITLSNSNLPTWMRLIRTTSLLHVTALLRSNKNECHVSKFSQNLNLWNTILQMPICTRA